MTHRPQLRLADDDMAAGVAAFRAAFPKYGAAQILDHAPRVVTEIVAAINEQRGGDPLGTVRRSSAGAYAIRVREAGGVYCWRLVHPNGSVDVFDGDLNSEVWQLVPRADGGS